MLLRLLGVSCRLIGAAKFVEEGAGAIAAVLSLVRLAGDSDDRGEFVLAARWRAGERRLRQEAVEAILGVHGRVDCLAKGVSDWRMS